MRDLQKHLEKLRDDSAECAIVAAEATETAKRELFIRLSKHLAVLADEVEKAINAAVQTSRE
jgi:hypothetical protein